MDDKQLLERERRAWADKEKKYREEISQLKSKRLTNFFWSKDNGEKAEAEKQQLVNDLQEQMAEENKQKVETLKDNIRMMMEESKKLEAELKKKDQLIEEMQKIQTSSASFDDIKENISKMMKDCKDEVCNEINTENYGNDTKTIIMKTFDAAQTLVEKASLGDTNSGESKISELMQKIVKLEKEKEGKVIITQATYDELKQSLCAAEDKEKYYKDLYEKMQKNDTSGACIELKKAEENARNLLAQKTAEFDLKVKQMEEDNNVINDKKIDLQMKLSDALVELSSLKQYVDDIKSGKLQLDDVVEGMKELKSENIAIQMQCTELQSQNDYLKSADEENKSKIRQMQTKLDEQSVLMQQSNKVAQDAEEGEERNKKEKQKYLRTIEDLQNEVKNLEDENKTQKAKLELEIDSKEKQRLLVESENDKLRREVLEAKSALAENKKKTRESEEAMTKRIVEMKMTKTDNLVNVQLEQDRLKARVEELENQNKTLEEKNTKMSLLLSARVAEDERAKRERNKKVQIIQFGKKQSVVGEEQVTLLGEKIGELQMEKAQICEELSKTSNVLKQKEMELAAWRSGVVDTYLKSVFSKMEKKSKDSFSQMQGIVQDLAAQNVLLQQEIAKFKQN
ncbi:Rho-associated protein kinase, putative [Entamoeba invadens IP1]|uniref:Rho-associated protein kinase, putative n=1 Tax=Entamoeba invadens IP1 TaxID=370355 RepID=UPI0002C3D7F1|nr:Rho-associated protein kinase, putative [Entamoeba invadens IP1]ELP94088.1 Rho-associated protein kinase, putative [Entamoeba invadens IP1]|eukprot:XP_004260859.1 Rho-associated protein kinase, putative [Entamoeba invadens IP1]